MAPRFAPEYRVDISHLSAGDRKALARLIEASRVLNHTFRIQMWSGNHDLAARLEQDHTSLGRVRYKYFLISQSPWSELDNGVAFVPGVPEKRLPGANFYPEDMTRHEFEAWGATPTPAQREQAQGFFSVSAAIPRLASSHSSLTPANTTPTSPACLLSCAGRPGHRQRHAPPLPLPARRRPA